MPPLGHVICFLEFFLKYICFVLVKPLEKIQGQKVPHYALLGNI